MRQESGLHARSSWQARAGARLATLAVLAGALATAASLIAVAYFASLGASLPPPRGSSARLAGLRESQIVAQRSSVLPRRSDDGSEETTIGSLVLVDVSPEIPSLDDELARQRQIARQRGQRVLVWVVVADCKPCGEVESTFGTPELQRALPHTRIVRIDAGHFPTELTRLGVPTDAFPAFVLIGPDGAATDYVHGGEWDEYLPGNIAPVLKSFLEGTYRHRRMPWHGGVHEDETAI